MSDEDELLQSFTIDQAAGALALSLGALGSLLLVIWQSRCMCRCRIGCSDELFCFDCERAPPPDEENPDDKKTDKKNKQSSKNKQSTPKEKKEDKEDKVGGTKPAPKVEGNTPREDETLIPDSNITTTITDEDQTLSAVS